MEKNMDRVRVEISGKNQGIYLTTTTVRCPWFVWVDILTSVHFIQF